MNPWRGLGDVVAVLTPIGLWPVWRPAALELLFFHVRAAVLIRAQVQLASRSRA